MVSFSPGFSLGSLSPLISGNRFNGFANSHSLGFDALRETVENGFYFSAHVQPQAEAWGE